MFGEMPAEQVRDAVERVALDVFAAGGVTAPPIDAAALARRLGMAVARDGPGDVRARFVQLGGTAEQSGRGTIYVADEPRPERRQWAVAHELGEAHANRVFTELGVDPVDAPPAAREAVANRLAGCLLLPRTWFFAEGSSCDWDLFQLKARFASASHELIARRMLEMPPAVIITVWDNGHRGWRLGNLPVRTPPVDACEADARRVAHESGMPTRCDRGELPEGIDDVRAWPIHEDGWRREIVRVELREVW
jgi:hypothetical protein